MSTTLIFPAVFKKCVYPELCVHSLSDHAAPKEAVEKLCDSAELKKPQRKNTGHRVRQKVIPKESIGSCKFGASSSWDC